MKQVDECRHGDNPAECISCQMLAGRPSKVAPVSSQAPAPQNDKRWAPHGSVELCLLCRCSLYGDKTCTFNCACHDPEPVAAQPSGDSTQPAADFSIDSDQRCRDKDSNGTRCKRIADHWGDHGFEPPAKEKR